MNPIKFGSFFFSLRQIYSYIRASINQEKVDINLVACISAQ